MENTTQQISQNSQTSIDWDKAVDVFKKSLVWIIAILIVTNLIAYFKIRWTKPVYESYSELKLDVKSDASELGILGLNENKNLNVVSSEIELLQSKLFFNKVIESVPLDISYYTEGRMLVDEKYGNAPFVVDYQIMDNSIYDQRIGVDLIDKNSFRISFPDGFNGTYKYGEEIAHSDVKLVLSLTDYFDPSFKDPHYFVLNSKERLINYFENNLSVEPLNLNANTIRISLQDNNQYKARALVDAIDSIYLNYSAEEKNRENTQKIEWLNKELQQIETQLEGYEDYFEAFTIENRTNDLDEDLSTTISAINKLDSQRYELAQQINLVDEVLKQLDSNLNQTFYDINVARFPEQIEDTYQMIAEKLARREQLKLSYNETTFAITKIDNEISAIKAQLKSQLEARRINLQEQVKNLIIRKKILEDEFVALPGKSTEYNKNQRFFELYEEFYLSLMQNKAEYQIAQAGTTTEFKILSPATLTETPIAPQRLIIHAIGAVSGFVICFLLVTIRYLMHDKISTVQELEKLTTAPVLGNIPVYSEKINVTRLVVNEKPKSAVSESLRSLRTNIEFMVPGVDSRVISITSTIGGEGKTFIAVNLGGILSVSSKKILILDLDMRKPRVHLAFGHELEDRGMSTILIDKHKAEECIRKTDVSNMDYIAAGPTPPNPSELLLNGRFSRLLDELKKSYDTIILDTPPVGLVTDGVLTLKKADLCIYVVRANYSKKIFLNTLNKLLNVNQFKHLAVVLNATSSVGSGSYGYGYYEEKKKGFLKKKK